MKNTENTIYKIVETLRKELERLSNEGLHEFFKFVYKMNHYQGNMIAVDKFEKFLTRLKSNQFKITKKHI